MKIENMKVNAYGKLHNTEIELDEKINIIYGKNESGKSTILKFIINSLYGTSKNKKGKEISDFEKFKPWEGEDFSGKLKYKLDNGESFEIYREFNKKNPKIFNENSEDISKEFSIDKSKGNNFFYEQTKIDEELFLSTSAILQQEVKIEKNKQTTLIQKIANLVGTGDDNVSYKRAIERLTRRQLGEIGTERSREKPINVISKKIQKLEAEINELESYENEKYEIENRKKEINNKIISEEIKFNILNDVKKINDKKEIEKEKIKLQEKLKKENDEKIILTKNGIANLENEIEKLKVENTKKKKEQKEKNKINNKKKLIKLIIILAIFLIINAVQFLLVKDIKLSSLILALSVAICGALVYINNKKQETIVDEEQTDFKQNNKIINLKTQLNLLEQNKKTYENEIERLKSEFNLWYNLEKEKIKNNFLNKINEQKKLEKNNYDISDENEIIKIINSENPNYLLDDLQKSINNDQIKLKTLDINKENIEKNLEIKTNLEEELSILSEQYVNLQNLNSSMNLTREVLDLCYEEMKESVTPKFTEQLSKTVEKITNRKIQQCKI